MSMSSVSMSSFRGVSRLSFVIKDPELRRHLGGFPERQNCGNGQDGFQGLVHGTGDAVSTGVSTRGVSRPGRLADRQRHPWSRAGGTTGESPTLSHAEHTRWSRSASARRSGRVPVIAGAGSNNTAGGDRSRAPRGSGQVRTAFSSSRRITISRRRRGFIAISRRSTTRSAFRSSFTIFHRARSSIFRSTR